METALLLIDIQNDYFDGGKNPLVNSLEASQNASLLLSHFRKTSQSCIFVKHLSSDPSASFFLPKTFGSEINATVAPLKNDKVIVKHFPNSFRETGLLELLKSKNITHLVICGMMTHMCVDATVRAAKDFGFECTVISDACATKDLMIQGQVVKSTEVHHSFLAAFSSYYAKVLSLNEFLK